MLIILSGPSGVGKGTVREELFKDDSLNLSYSISMTTRKPRPTETDGVDYFFVDEKSFVDKIAQGGLLEWARFVGNYYGTPKDNVDRLLDEGKNVVLEIEVQGALQVMKKCPDALTIFLVPPSLEELERRIRGRRTESEDIVKERLDKARKEIQTKDEYMVFVPDLNTNNTSGKTLEEALTMAQDLIATYILHFIIKVILSYRR